MLPTSGFGKKGWGILILAFLSLFINSMIIYDSLNVTVAAFADALGTKAAVLYIFSTVCAWISVPGAMFFGWLCGKKTCRVAWGAGLLANACACFLWGYAANAAVYFAACAVCHVCGMGFAYISDLNVVSNWFPTKKGLAMGFVTIGFPFSATIASALCSRMLRSIGLSGIYTIFGLFCAALGAAVLLFVRDYPEQAGAFPDNESTGDRKEASRRLAEGIAYQRKSPWSVQKFLHTKTTWRIGFGLGVMELVSLGVMTNFVPRMAQLGFTLGQTLPMLATAGAAACFGSLACGVVDNRLGPKRAAVLTCCFGVVSLAVNIVGGLISIGGRATAGYIIIFISQPFLGVMLGGAANYLVSVISTIWGRYDFDVGYRVMKPIVAIIGALGMTICGAVGNGLPQGYTLAYAALCLLTVAAALVIGRMDDGYVGRSVTQTTLPPPW